MTPVRFHPFFSVAAAIALTAAFVLPASAQRQSLADRVSALEVRTANDRGNLDLLNQVGEMRNELQQLRALVEQLQNENEQLKQRNRDQYLDLDGRLNRLEGGGAVPPAAPPVAAGPAVTPAAAPARAPADERPPAVHGDASAIAQAGDERTAYGVAFNALKAGNYADASQLFLSFLELHPSGAYAPNALYWLGESYYVTQNYQLAMEQFRTLLAQYPTHDKASGALLKLGLAEYGLGQADAAERTLAQVLERYPGSDVARTADDRLRTIRVSRMR